MAWWKMSSKQNNLQAETNYLVDSPISLLDAADQVFGSGYNSKTKKTQSSRHFPRDTI